MRIYERLNQVYDLGWGKFSRNYLILIKGIFSERGIQSARVLDLACGTGSLAVALAGLGHSVYGIDISPEMIAVARSKGIGISNLSFRKQNMARFRVPGQFDLVICAFDALNYLTNRRDLNSLFERVSGSLRQSGLFIFDSTTHQHFISLGDGSRKQEINRQSFLQEWRYDANRRIATTTFKFADDVIEVHKQRPYDLSNLEPLIRSVGLQVVETLSWFDGETYDVHSRRLICISQKTT